MTGRGPWLVSGGLVVVAGVLTSLASWRHWAGCRSDPRSAVCRTVAEQSDGLSLWGGAPTYDGLQTGAASVAAGLLVVAWVVVIGWSRGSVYRRLLAVVVGLQPLLVVALIGLVPQLRATGGGWLTWPAEVLVLPFLLGAGWALEDTAGHTIRLIVLGWAVTSFGPVHRFVDFALTTQASGVVADSPPGLGAVTAITQIGLGVGVVVMSMLIDRAAGPDDDDDGGRSGFTLAA